MGWAWTSNTRRGTKSQSRLSINCSSAGVRRVSIFIKVGSSQDRCSAGVATSVAMSTRARGPNVAILQPLPDMTYRDPLRLRLRGRGGIPLDAAGVAPEVVEVVVAARVLAEDVQDDVVEVEHDPARVAVVARARDRAEVVGLAKLLGLVADRPHLARARAGADHEKVGDGGDPADVQHDDVVAARGREQAGHLDREPAGRVKVSGCRADRRRWVCGGTWRVRSVHGGHVAGDGSPPRGRHDGGPR